MANGPNIQGEVNLDTKDLDKAIKEIKKLEKAFKHSSDRLSKATNKASDNIGKMAEGLGASVSGSKRAGAAVKGLGKDQEGLAGSTDKVKSSITSNINAINKAEIAHQKLEARIKASALADDKKDQELKEVRQSLNSTTAAIDKYGSKSAIAAQRTADFRKRITASSIAVAGANRSFRGQAIADFRTKMQNLTSSVQLALGPLSGVASRLTALAGLFNRNAAAVATLFGAMTLLSITFSRSMTAAQEAETTYLRTESVLKNMGGTASVTADEIMEMGSSIAMATLTSTQEARSAAVALAGFGGVAADTFERVIITAQGVSEQFGGDLVSSTKILGRALQDPERRLTSLERKIGTFSAAVKEQIETLVRSGDIAGAQAVILEAMSSKFDLATDSAQGLAGSLDTTSELATKMYEKLGLASGATAEAARQVNNLNKKFKEFIDSDTADAIGRLFVNAISNLGKAINFLADHAAALAMIFNALLGGAVVRLVAMFARMLSPVGTLIKGFTRMGVAAATGGTAVKAFASAFGSLNPAMLAVKAVALVLAPLIGTLVSKFLTSGNAAKSATPEIDKYAESLDSVLSNAKALSKWKPQLLIDASEISVGRQELGLLSRQINHASQEFNNLKVGSAIPELRAFAVQAGVSFDKIISNAEVFGKVLSGVMDIGDAPLELQKDLKAISDASENVMIQSEGLADDYLMLKVRIEKLRSEAEELTRSIKEQEGALEDDNEVTRTFAQNVDRLTSLTSNLADEFDKEHQNIKDLRSSLTQAANAHDFFATHAAFGGEKSEEFADRAETLRRVITKLKEELADATDTTEELSSSYFDISKSINDANRSLKNLNSMVQGGEDLRRNFEISDAVSSARKSIDDLNNNELNKLGSDFNLIQGFNESTGEFKARVKDAYGVFVKENLKAKDSANALLEAQTTLDNFFKENRSTVEELRDKYKELYGEAFTANASQEQLAALRDRFNSEKALLTEQSAEMAQFAAGLSTQQIATQREARIEALREMWTGEKEELKKHIKEMNDEADKATAFASFGEKAQLGADMAASAMDTMRIAQREQTDAYKNFARAQIILSSAVAIAAAIQTGMSKDGSLAVGLAKAALVSAKMGAQLAAVNSAGYADGGYVSGKGSSTSDSINARLSNGEYVINAAAVRKLGLSNLNTLNSGEMPQKLSDGGSVGTLPMASGGSSSNGSQVNVQVIDQRSGDSAPIEREESMTPDGIRSIRILVKDAVNEAISNGGTDRAMAQNYGVGRRPKKR